MNSLKFGFNDYRLIQGDQSFHPGGLLSTLYLLGKLPGLSADSTLLDYGCGTGTTLKLLAPKFKHLAGYEKHEDSAELARLQTAGLPVRMFSELEKLSKEMGKIDFLLLESVLAFQTGKSKTSFIKTLKEVCRTHQIKYIGLIEMYCEQPLPPSMKRILNSVYGIKEVMSKSDLENLFTPGYKISHLKDFAPIAPALQERELPDPRSFVEYHKSFFEQRYSDLEVLLKSASAFSPKLKTALDMMNQNCRYAVMVWEAV